MNETFSRLFYDAEPQALLPREQEEKGARKEKEKGQRRDSRTGCGGERFR